MANLVSIAFMRANPKKGAPEYPFLDSDTVSEEITSSGTAQATTSSSPFKNGVVRIYTDTAINVVAGATPVATVAAGVLIPAAAAGSPNPVYFGVDYGDKISVINYS